jgi:hypothetical protein
VAPPCLDAMAEADATEFLESHAGGGEERSRELPEQEGRLKSNPHAPSLHPWPCLAICQTAT